MIGLSTRWRPTRIFRPDRDGSSGRHADLYDAVTLQHAAAVGRLPLLPSLYGYRPEPRWTEKVKSEVEAGARMIGSAAWCQPVLDFDWLGPAVSDDNLLLTFELQTQMNSLGDSPDKNLGRLSA